MESKLISIRFPMKDFLKIKKRADKARMSMNRYVVLSSLGKTIKIYPDLREVASELFQIRNLLEQMYDGTCPENLIEEVETLCLCCGSLMARIAIDGN